MKSTPSRRSEIVPETMYTYKRSEDYGSFEQCLTACLLHNESASYSSYMARLRAYGHGAEGKPSVNSAIPVICGGRPEAGSDLSVCRLKFGLKTPWRAEPT